SLSLRPQDATIISARNGKSSGDIGGRWPRRGVRPRSTTAGAESLPESGLVRLSEDMKRIVLEQRLGFAATVCADGTPNLSPKGTTTLLDDDHLLFADIHSPGTVRNLEQNTSIELNVVDPIVRKGYRFKGNAEVHRDG